MSNWIETRSGKRFVFESDDIESIDIMDIAWALGNECRFGGHCNRFYSVAEHSCRVYDAFFAFRKEAPREAKLYALLHDASEAYLKDIMRPLKLLPQMSGYKLIEKTVQLRIERAFQLDREKVAIPYLCDVDDFDNAFLKAEAAIMLPSKGEHWEFPENLPAVSLNEFCGWRPDRARVEFLNRFHEAHGWQ